MYPPEPDPYEARPERTTERADVNRQTKRAMKKQEERKQRQPRPTPKAGAPGAPGKKQRTKPRQFVKEVVDELRKVAWPNRQEIVGYSMVVLIASVVIAALIFGMDYVFGNAILALFGVDI